MANSYDIRTAAVKTAAAMSVHLLHGDTDCSGLAAAEALYEAAVELYPVRKTNRQAFIDEVKQEVYNRIQKLASPEEAQEISEATGGKWDHE